MNFKDGFVAFLLASVPFVILTTGLVAAYRTLPLLITKEACKFELAAIHLMLFRMASVKVSKQGLLTFFIIVLKIEMRCHPIDKFHALVFLICFFN